MAIQLDSNKQTNTWGACVIPRVSCVLCVFKIRFRVSSRESRAFHWILLAPGMYEEGVPRVPTNGWFWFRGAKLKCTCFGEASQIERYSACPTRDLFSK